jgi:hypothetical protein
VARFLQRTVESLLYKEFAAESLPVIDAAFERTGNSLGTVEERVFSDEDEIILSCWNLMPPFVLTMPPEAMNRPLGVYSAFLPARGAQLSVNSEAATAKVIMQDRFGKPASGCCLAWSETSTKPRGYARSFWTRRKRRVEPTGRVDRARAVRRIGRSALTAAMRGAVVSCSFGRIAETVAIGQMPPHRRTAAAVRSSAIAAVDSE